VTPPDQVRCAHAITRTEAVELPSPGAREGLGDDDLQSVHCGQFSDQLRCNQILIRRRPPTGFTSLGLKGTILLGTFRKTVSPQRYQFLPVLTAL
jgi:hypothetical protein